MSGASDYAVVYDISSGEERRHVNKVLKDFGFRVQKSVFECRMNRRGRQELVARLEKLGIKTGFVKIYRLEYSYGDGKVIGEDGGPGIDRGSAFII